MPDVAFAPLEPGDFGRVDIETQNSDRTVAKRSCQRQADVAEADDPDADFPRLNLGQKCVRDGRTGTDARIALFLAGGENSESSPRDMGSTLDKTDDDSMTSNRRSCLQKRATSQSRVSARQDRADNR